MSKASSADTSWFVHDRFGMFIHWGLYALPARHEWIKNYEEIPDDVYETYFKHFDPDLYDPEAWAAAAAGALPVLKPNVTVPVVELFLK
jgi:alpha-L-fucosidase